MDSGEHDSMQQAIDKLTLNDSSVTVSKTRSSALGYGWRLGFLGILHMEVFQQRLEEVCANKCGEYVCQQYST